MKISRLEQIFYLGVYYGFARYLPPSHKNFFGRFGGGIRRICCQHLFKYCAPTANIEHMARFGKGHGVEIGHRSGIGIHCSVPNDIKIGDDVMMGPHCYLLGNRGHRYDRTDIPMIEQGSARIKGRTTIGDDVWMGRQCIVIAGKHIGSHTIIGAGTVVCKDVPDYVVAAGNPVRVVRNRLSK